jgi:uncharacterized membrane protein HdeD (DUF308 family)
MRVSGILMFITGVFHALGLFVKSEPKNETEKTLMTIMDTYSFDMGIGFHRKFSEIYFALSSCFSLLCLFGALINIWVATKLDFHSKKKMLITELIIFGILACIMFKFTFLPPIICTSLIFIALVIEWYNTNKNYE